MNGCLGESRDKIGPNLHAERDDQVIVVDFLILQFDLLTFRIDAQNLGLDEFDIALFQQAQATGDLPALALADHDKQKRRHEQMVGALVD